MNQVREVLGAPKIPGSAAATGQAAVTTEAEDDLYEDGPAWESTAPSSIPAAAPVTRPAPPPAAPSPPVPAAAQSSTPSNANTKGKQRADAAPQAGLAVSSTTTNSAQQAARAALQKKKREDAEELARIKARIEQDKAARKAQAEARKAEREQERAAAAQQSPSPQPHPSTSTAATTSSTRGSQSPTVHLSIRLFDGRTIRTTFPRTATLTTHVRPWIDTEFASLAPSDPNIMNRATLPPYFFRHILPPQPSRELSAGDEADSLGDIDLAPSATLVLVPVKGYSDAYAGRGGAGSSGTNLLAGTTTGLVSGAFGLLSSTVGYAGSLLGGFLGGAQQPQGQGGAQGRTTGGGDGGSGSAAESGPAAGRDRGERDEHGNIRVRTLADQRAREPRSQQFYNGNQVRVLKRLRADRC